MCGFCVNSKKQPQNDVYGTIECILFTCSMYMSNKLRRLSLFSEHVCVPCFARKVL
jgi:hypothetical protein